MASFTKPTAVPRWADTNALIIEPPEAKKDAGWLFQEVPPSNFENWRTQLNGDWWKWVDERLADGPSADVLAVLDPSGSNADPVVEIDGITALQSSFIFRDGATTSELRVTKDTQILQWLAGGTQSVLIDPFRLTVGPSAGDSLNLFGTGDLKGITFNSNSNQLRYRISNNTFGVHCNDGVTAKLEVTPDRVRHLQPIVGVPQINIGGNAIPAATHSRFENGLHVGDDVTVLGDGELFVANRVSIDNTGFYLAMSGIDRRLSFNTEDDSITYDVSTGIMDFQIGGEAGMGIYPDVGGGTFVGANAFIPGNTGDYNTLRYESGARNAVGMAVKATFAGGGGIIAGSRPWNIDSVERTGNGQFRVHPDQAISNYSTPVAGINGGGLLGRVTAFHSTNSYIGVTTITSAGGTASDFQFNLIVVGT